MTKETYVRNPETGRLIKVGGPTYNRLKKQKKQIKQQNKIQKAKFEASDDDLVSSYIKLRKNKKVDYGNESWESKKPKTKKEREEVLNKYGRSCFLIPDKLKFPICNKSDGAYNCKGLKAASSRAGQWGYKKVLEKSKKITEKLNCYSTKNKSKKN
jgi:hypothetical protein